ncbi:MAG: YihY/virulence factor BrkB family protein [Lachnospiraceae bacterium]|nr:YihY/virulence factor BrkB family protein [Lachnospiraceae bacterium]
MRENGIVRIYYEMREFTQNMKKENLSAFASSAAFFIFLSLVPILIVVCAIIPYTPLTEENLLGLILEITPGRIEAIVIKIVDDVYHRAAGVLSAAVLVTLWSAGKGVLAVIRGLNAVNEVEEHRNYFMVRVVSSFYTLIMLLIILVSMILLVFGNTLVNMLVVRLPKLEILFSFLMNFRFLVIWLILTAIFSAFYAYLPDKKLRFKEQLSGASFAAVLWSIFSWCFSMYVDYGNSFNIYGSLTIIVIFMMWLYICIYIMFVGAYINKHLNVLAQE